MNLREKYGEWGIILEQQKALEKHLQRKSHLRE